MKAKPKTIIHLVQSLHTGGTEHVLLKTLPLLSKEFEHHIITLKEPGELAPKFAEKHIAVTNLGAKSFFDLAYRQKLRRYVDSFHPVLIITHMFHADVAGRLLLQGKKAAPVVSSLVTTYNFSRYWPARWFERLSKPWARHYFANSEAVKDFYVKHIGVQPNKITVIHNGIDVSLYDNATGGDVVKELGLPQNRIIITCVANLAINKGHAYLLEAFESMFPLHPEAYVLIVGDGQERDNLRQQVEPYAAKDHIKFLGRRSDVPNILAATDIFVLPTLFEGLSNAILEAMAAKCAVITTDIPENRVMVKPNRTGVLVPIKNVDAISRALIQLIEHPQQRLDYGKNARQYINDCFDLQHIARELDAELRRFALKTEA